MSTDNQAGEQSRPDRTVAEMLRDLRKKEIETEALKEQIERLRGRERGPS